MTTCLHLALFIQLKNDPLFETIWIIEPRLKVNSWEKIVQCGNIMRRATIFVRDADRSAKFYCDVFGFTVYSEQSITLRDGSPVTIGATDAPRPGRFVTVKGRNPLAGMIGMISIEDPVEDRHSGGRLGIGNVVLVIETEDIDHAANSIVEAGGTIVHALHDAENTGDENGNKVPSRRFFARDPDGYVLEVFCPNE